MKVLVTGATGYVGSHAAVGLLRADHTVRVLARRPEQVERTYAPHPVTPDEVVAGDVLDVDVVRAAVAGCDAVVHAAAVFDLDPRHEARLATNAAATEVVLGTAVTAGCDPVVHVSSTVALVRHGGSGPDLPLGDIDEPYARSKIESERVARRLQDSGAPVVTVYPGGVHGPHDPYVGDQASRVAAVARGLLPAWPTGGAMYVDVREVAAVVVAAVESGRGPKRYVVPGHHLDGRAYFAAISSAIGRRRPVVVLPAAVARASTRPVRALHRVLPESIRYPADPEGVELHRRDCRLDDTAARTELGVLPRPWQETMDDTIAWLVDIGRLPASYRPGAH
ncbi:NAD-dependent epimerase/dehydratase family protein [Oryzobacter sp. R7]|uniref:NAD-dependent epimerase/dehydratase family protein n=1 Tax=Oryzobacter faecalis TaxID=3388656 RepID=UPI00398D2F76